MINRDNYLDVQKYIDFLKSVNQCEDRTIATYWPRFKHLIEWADGTRFTAAMKIRPSFPTYLAGLKDENGAPRIGTSHFAACCKTSKAFFKWAREEYPRVYKDIDPNWIKSIRPPKARSEQAEVKKREIYTLEETIRLVTFPVNTMMLRRMQAACAFLFLSGMRIGAFVSMPINCVDLDNLMVHQLPSRGVLTKNHKADNTTLLNIPELLAVVRDWDSFIRSRVPDHILWYVPLTHDLQPASVNPTKERIKTRHDDFRGDLRTLCETAGMTYKSPHKFRHGHAVYGLKRARNMGEMKAVSQNLMHATVGITDGIYGNLVGDDVHQVITSLSEVKPASGSQQEALQQAIELLQRMASQQNLNQSHHPETASPVV